MDSTWDIVTYEFPSVCSELDIEMFRAWRTVHNTTWTRAVVDRSNGLTLLSEEPNGHGTALHFSCALCGFRGEGPIATVTILEQAGFGPASYLEMQVYNQRHVTFVK